VHTNTVFCKGSSHYLMYNGKPFDNAIWNEERAKSRID